jgi:hypothetical protein
VNRYPVYQVPYQTDRKSSLSLSVFVHNVHAFSISLFFSHIVEVSLYMWRKPECPEKTTDLPQVIDKLYHIMLYRSRFLHFALLFWNQTWQQIIHSNLKLCRNIVNQCPSPLMLWVLIPVRRGVLDTTLCDKVCPLVVMDTDLLCFDKA